MSLLLGGQVSIVWQTGVYYLADRCLLFYNKPLRLLNCDMLYYNFYGSFCHMNCGQLPVCVDTLLKHMCVFIYLEIV